MTEWYDINRIQTLSSIKIDELCKDDPTLIPFMKSIKWELKNENIEKIQNKSFYEEIMKSSAVDYDIEKLLNKRDDIMRRNQIQNVAHRNINDYYILGQENPLKTNKLPLAPYIPIYEETFTAFKNAKLVAKIDDACKLEVEDIQFSELKNRKLRSNKNDINFEILKASVRSGLSWKYLNIQKHGIGGIEAISKLISYIIKTGLNSVTDKINLKFGQTHVVDLFKPYVATDDTFNHENAYKHKDYPFKWTTEIGTIKSCDSSENRISHIKLYAQFLFDVFKTAIECVKNVSNHYIQNIHRDTLSSKELEQLDKNINSSIKSLENLLYNVLFNYIGVMPKKKKSAFGFTDRSDYGRIKTEDIKSTYNITMYSFISIYDTVIEEAMQEMLFKYQEDLNGKPIEMGGFCQETFIFQLSLNIYNKTENIKKGKAPELKALDQLIELQKTRIYMPSLHSVYNSMKDLAKIKRVTNIFTERRLNIARQVSRFNKHMKYNKRDLEILRYKYNRINLTIKFIRQFVKVKYPKYDTDIEKIDETSEATAKKEYGFSIHDLIALDINTTTQLNNNNNRPLPKSKANALLNDMNKLAQEIDRDINNSTNNNSSNNTNKNNKSTNNNDSSDTKKKKKKKSTNNNSSDMKKKKKSTNNSNNNSPKISQTVLKKYKRLGAIYKKIKGKTIYIPYIDRGLLRPDRFGLINIFNVALNGQFSDGDVIPGNKIKGPKGIKDLSSTGYILVGGNLTDMKYNAKWRAINFKIIKAMMDMGSSSLRKRVDRLLSDEYTYNKYVKYNWSDSSQTKQKVKKYCAYIKRKMKKDGKKGKCDILLHTARVSKWIM